MASDTASGSEYVGSMCGVLNPKFMINEDKQDTDD